MANPTHERSLLRLFAAHGATVRLVGGGVLLTLAAGVALLLSGTFSTTQHAQGLRCLYNDDCPGNLICEANRCRVECRTSRDCYNGWVCIDGAARGVRAEVEGKLRDVQAEGDGRWKICADPRMLSAQPVTASEQNTTRPGMDYNFFPDGTLDEKLCRKRCQEDPVCASFTYVKPGLHAATAYCYLKHGAPAPFPESCCTSGVVRQAPAVQEAVPAAKPK